MYYIIYPIFYFLSLLPWRVMYFIGDGIYVLVYYLIGYRKEVVFKNIGIAFPEKTAAERKRIAKDFYHHFIDTFIETIKLISISKEAFNKRLKMDRTILDELYASGQNVQIHSSHFFNWEFLNLGVCVNMHYPWLGIFTPISNKAFSKIIWDMRSKFGTILIPSTEFKSKFHLYAKERYALGLVADQNPGHPENAYWVNFFGRLTPFVKGPEKGAKTMNTAVVMVEIYKIKRGYYQIDSTLLTTKPQETPEGFITKSLINLTEECIRKNPSNYLWSHKRWKFNYEEKYKHLVIE